MPSPLITAWRQASLKSPPFIFPGDEILLQPQHRKKISIIKSFSEYCRSAQMGGPETELQLGLLPLPYWGDIERAEVYLLMLNPGLRPVNFYSEYKIPSCRTLLRNNLKQKGLDEVYPNMFLNPRYCWDGGFSYWTEKFKSILKTIMIRQNATFQESLGILSRRVACLQLAPYHSRSFQSGSLIPKLASSKLARTFVHEELLPKAHDGKIRIIVLRGNHFWGLRENKQVIVYRNQEARVASLSASSRGGRAILNQVS